MRISHSTQPRLDSARIDQIELNLNCRDEIIPILFALKHIYTRPDLRDQILQLVAEDVNGDSSTTRGRRGMSYWQILVLAAVRLGCNLNYDRLQDLAENHRKLRHMMEIGDWDDDTSFHWQRIRDNICLLKPETIARISQLLVADGHRIHPEAAAIARVDSFVVETNIHYPTESSLIWDGLRKIIELCTLVANDLNLSGWRQAAHLRQKVKQLHREISRASASKKPNKMKQVNKLYGRLFKRTKNLLERAENLVQNTVTADALNISRVEQVRMFVERTRQVASTAYRRVVFGETVPNSDKLFSIFEPHTQLYRRGKAGQENQFGRLLLIYEDGIGFITHHYMLERNETDEQVAVKQTQIVQSRLSGAVAEISFDRGFYSAKNAEALKKIVSNPCLPMRAVNQYNKQMKTGSVNFRAQRQRHPGVESAIGAVQSGNGLKRSRDRTEFGFERYLALGILGRNLHVLGKLLIAQLSPDCHAAKSKRNAA